MERTVSMIYRQKRSPNHFRRAGGVLLAALFTIASFAQVSVDTANAVDSCAPAFLEPGAAVQYTEWGVLTYDGRAIACCGTVPGGTIGPIGGTPTDGAPTADNWSQPKTITLTGSNNAEKVMNFLLQNGWKEPAAAGIMGNFMQESHFYPGATNPNNGAYGVAQWLGSRLTALRSYGGGNANTLEVQLQFLMHELSTTEKASWATNNATDPVSGAIQWERLFERSGGQGDSNRQKFAKAIYDQWVATKTLPNDFLTKLGGAPALDNSGGTTPSFSAVCSTSTTPTTLVNGLPPGGVKTTREAWEVAKLFLSDLNKIRAGKDPYAPYPAITDADIMANHSSTPGQNATGSPCFPGASNCDQCFALTAWFIDKFTTLKMGATPYNGRAAGDGVVSFLAGQGVPTSNKAELYSVFSMGRLVSGDPNAGAHTGVIVGINGDKAITVELNYLQQGGLFVRELPRDGLQFDKTHGGKTIFAVLQPTNFKSTPKEY